MIVAHTKTAVPGHNYLYRFSPRLGRQKGKAAYVNWREKKVKDQLVSEMRFQGLIIPTPTELFTISVRPNAREDVPNVTCGLHKVALDAMKHAGWIEDDGPRFITGVIGRVVVKKGCRCDIYIFTPQPMTVEGAMEIANDLLQKIH